MIDLHIHSNYSDGTLSPSEIIKKAERLSLKAVAITDHDTASGLNEAFNAVKNKKVVFIPGIELSVAHKPGELHILGLGIKKWENAPILEKISLSRKKRNSSIVKIMNENGLNITFKDLENQTKGTIGRPHFAAWLKSRGIAGDINEAFSSYLTWGKPFYIPRETITLTEAIDFIHSCGGKAIIAHPLNIPVNFTVLLEKIERWLAAGIDGIEAVHSGARRNLTKRLISYGEKKGVLITGGSDFHGVNKPGIKMGKTKELGEIGDEYLPEYFLRKSVSISSPKSQDPQLT